MGQRELLTDLFVKNPEGVTPVQIASRLNTSVQNAYKVVHRLRSSGFSVRSVDGKYLTAVAPASEPAAKTSTGTQFGRLLELIKSAGNGGITTEQICHNMDYQRPTAQSAVMDLRDRKFRIDNIEGRYIFRGTGKSHIVVNGKERILEGRRSTRKKRGSKGTSLVRGSSGQSPATHTPLIVPSAPKATGPVQEVSEIFSLHTDNMNRVAGILPDDVRRGLMETVKAADSYNKIARLCLGVQNQIDQILSSLPTRQQH